MGTNWGSVFLGYHTAKGNLERVQCGLFTKLYLQGEFKEIAQWRRIECHEWHQWI